MGVMTGVKEAASAVKEAVVALMAVLKLVGTVFARPRQTDLLRELVQARKLKLGAKHDAADSAALSDALNTDISAPEAAYLLKLKDRWAALADRRKAWALVRFREKQHGWEWTNVVRPDADGTNWINRIVQPWARRPAGKRVLIWAGAGAYSIATCVLVVTLLSVMVIGMAYYLHGVPSRLTQVREAVEFSGLLCTVGAYAWLGHLCIDLVCRYEAAQRLIGRGGKA